MVGRSREPSKQAAGYGNERAAREQRGSAAAARQSRPIEFAIGESDSTR